MMTRNLESQLSIHFCSDNSIFQYAIIYTLLGCEKQKLVSNFGNLVIKLKKSVKKSLRMIPIICPLYNNSMYSMTDSSNRSFWWVKVFENYRWVSSVQTAVKECSLSKFQTQTDPLNCYPLPTFASEAPQSPLSFLAGYTCWSQLSLNKWKISKHQMMVNCF